MNRIFQEIFKSATGVLMLATASTFGGEMLRYDQPRGGAIAISYYHITLAELISRAENGSARSQMTLAEFYHNGTQGAAVNKVEAYKWAVLAVAHGYKPAKYLIEEFDLFLTEADKAAGRKLADSFLSKQKSRIN